ncbi:helix-turn-helix domain-containing protein [Lentzea aerocolonigenes]|uniref:helix-turn-helix domain-containing protein n=1 Tax=Lentzea aerocolonigenes TaxID=68170 RepID=UPI0004C4613A|nr:helix-turn-helix transcriptional regulator [Lentzea aerocolonigenes]MCP2242493.1 Helix-turn-helix domain-containing protein [Lentzea aerocolonigenes]
MDPTRAIWDSQEVRVAVDSGDLGAIVRAVRRATPLTLADLAEKCGYSISTLSRMERGKQPLRDVQVLRCLAKALKIPPHLLGLTDTRSRSVHAPRPVARVNVILAPDEETDPMRRRTLLAGLTSLAGTAALGAGVPSWAKNDPVDALERALLAPPSTGAIPVEVTELRRQVAEVRSVFQLGHYTESASRLPAVLSTAMATRAEAENPADANSLMADLYTLASELMVKLNRTQSALITADRAVQTAHDTDDILTQATAHRAWAIVLRRTGHADAAQSLISDSIESLQPDLHRGPEHLSVYGSLLSTAAYTAAVDGDRDTALTLTAEAVEAAARLGSDGNHRFTAFGPTGVGLYRISVARALGDYGAAIEAARRINPAAIPVAERRARYWSDIAHAFHEWNKPEQSLRALLAAEQASPDEVRYRKPIQQITISLLRHPTARALPGLEAFAARTGAVA